MSYRINSEGSLRSEDIDGPTPEWLLPIIAKEKIKKVWRALSLFTLIVNMLLLAFFFFVLIYNITVQLVGIQENFGCVYILAVIAVIFFCFFHSLLGLGWLNSLIYLLLILVFSWIWEEFGVLTGVLFGAYHYTDLMPYHISQVPLEIPFSWFVFQYLSFSLADLIINGQSHIRTKRLTGDWRAEFIHGIMLSLTTGIVIVGWDLVADPMGSTTSNLWQWEHDNGYFFGVPLLNYFGWFLVTVVFTGVYLLLEHFNPIRPIGRLSLPHALCPVVLYCGFILYYFCLSDPAELGLVALFSMGMPVLIALFRMVQASMQDHSAEETDGYDPILEASRNYDDFYDHASEWAITPTEDSQ